MWMNVEVTFSREWKTKELRQVMTLQAKGP